MIQKASPAGARFRLDDRVAVVTGVRGRLGPVWASALLDAGARVVGLDRPGAPDSALYSSLAKSAGKNLLSLKADVRQRKSLARALKECEQRAGMPTILVNNAGIDAPPAANGTRHRLTDMPLDASREILEVNVLGAFRTAQVFGQGMIQAGHGSIINIGSLYASVAPDPRLYDHLASDPPFLKPPFYGASKAALINLTRQLAVHWAPFGVRVNSLSPGGVRGDQDAKFQRKFNARVPLARMATSEDLVGPLLFLASDASSYVTGIDLRVDGGFAIL